MQAYEWALLDDIRNRIAALVADLQGRVYVLADERLLPEAVALPACGVLRGERGRIELRGAGSYVATYDVDIWLYAMEWTGRERSQQDVYALTDAVLAALWDYTPLSGRFTAPFGEVVLEAPHPAVDLRTGAYAVRRRITLTYAGTL